LWDWYASEVKKVGPVDVLVVNGDAVDGDGSKDTIDHITTDMEDQADIAEKSIRQIKAKKIYMTYGTPFHVAGTMKYENMIAKSLGCEIADTIYLNVNGTRFSFRHATGNAGTPYTQGTQTYKEAVRDLVTAIETEQEPKYVRMYVIPGDVVLAQNELVTNFQILIVDQLNNDYSNQRDLMSDTLEICKDLTATLYLSEYENLWPVSVEPILENYETILAGWVMNIQLTQPFDYNRCVLPERPFGNKKWFELAELWNEISKDWKNV
jgi:hypothetical protein